MSHPGIMAEGRVRTPSDGCHGEAYATAIHDAWNEIPIVLFRVNNNGRPKTDQQSSNEASETVREACS
jgi:hypothetical protein